MRGQGVAHLAGLVHLTTILRGASICFDVVNILRVASKEDKPRNRRQINQSKIGSGDETGQRDADLAAFSPDIILPRRQWGF